jgi:hypothetical protein
MILKLGSKGESVKEIQEFLGITMDGDFGPKTERAVKEWQKTKGLFVDGIVGPSTWNAMGIATTDISEIALTDEIVINKSYLPDGEYYKGPVDKEYLFLHHTAGGNNPYRTIIHWGRDSRGRIATEFVIGGKSIDGDDQYDGEIVQSFPEGGYSWHLGKNGLQHMHVHSVGIEVCNYGYLTKGGYKKKINGKRVWVDRDPDSYYAYTGSKIREEDIVFTEEFRGYTAWHAYTDKQIESLKELILYIKERDGIDIQKGLISEYKKNGLESFEWNSDAYYGRIKGMWTHTNTKKGKSDMSPQPKLIEMLLSL